MTDENDTLGRSTGLTEEIESAGSGILNSLKSQQETMSNVRAKTETMLTKLGMSDNIITLIERRGKGDLLIFFGGAIFILCFMYFLVGYVKPAWESL
jgi:hypothetical protein